MKHWFSRIAIALGFGFALYPMLLWYVRRMSDGSDEPLGLFALAAAAYFGWVGRDRIKSGTAAQITALVCLSVYGLLAWLEFPPLLRALPALAAVVAWFGWWRMPAVVVLLGLSLPVMASLQFYLGFPLRLFVAESSVCLLNLANIEVVRQGAQLVHGGIAVGVDPPCSGVRMLWASGFLAVALAGKLRLAWSATIGLAVIAMILAVLSNTIRATLLFFPEADILTLPYFAHELIGALCFAAGVALLLAAARKFQFHPVTRIAH